jgi:hypothetical protein
MYLKQNKTKQNKTKQNKTKQNKTKQNSKSEAGDYPSSSRQRLPAQSNKPKVPSVDKNILRNLDRKRRFTKATRVRLTR